MAHSALTASILQLADQGRDLLQVLHDFEFALAPARNPTDFLSTRCFNILKRPNGAEFRVQLRSFSSFRRSLRACMGSPSPERGSLRQLTEPASQTAERSNQDWACAIFCPGLLDVSERTRCLPVKLANDHCVPACYRPWGWKDDSILSLDAASPYVFYSELD